MKIRIRRLLDSMDEMPFVNRVEFAVSSKKAAEEAVTIINEMMAEDGHPMRYRLTIVMRRGMAHYVKLERPLPTNIDKKRKPISTKASNGIPTVKVLCLTTGEVFDGFSDAAKAFGTTANNVRQSCKRGCRAAGKRFEVLGEGSAK